MDFNVEPLQSAVPVQEVQVPKIDLEPKLKIPKFSTALVLAIVCGALLLIAGVLFLVFRGASFSERNIDIELAAKSDISSGDTVTYELKIKNDNRESLDNVQLTFFYPSDAIALHDGQISSATNDKVIIGTIDGQTIATRTFTAIVVGSQGSIKTARAVVTYTPAHLSSQLQKTVEANVNIIALPLQFTAVAPPTVLDGQTVQYFIDYRNQTNDTYDNVRIVAHLPDGFTVTNQSPRSSGGGAHELYWDIDQIVPSDASRITIEGTIRGTEHDAKVLSVEFKRRLTADESAPLITFEKADATSVIARAFISTAISLQGMTDYIAHVGDSLKYIVEVSNNSDVDLTSIELRVKFDGVMYDLGSIESDGVLNGSTRTVLWTNAVVPELGLLRAHQSVTVPVRIQLKKTFPTSLGSRDSVIKASAHIETSNVPESFSVDTLSADAMLTSRISTTTALNQELLIKDTHFPATGVYPPQVDKHSLFTVHWIIANPGNDVTPAKVTAVLMPGVTWENQFALAGTTIGPKFNPKLSTVTWDLGTVPAGVGVSYLPFELFFQIGVTPSINQVDQTVPLVKDIVFEGVDVLTKEKIVTSQSTLDSGSVNDTREGGSVLP